MKDIINTNKFMFYIYLITLVIVVLLSIKIKPFGNPDEGAHFLRAYEISKGHFFNTKGNIGVNISCREYEIIAKKYAPIAFEQQFNKKGEKNVYVNCKDGHPTILVECKDRPQNLNLHDGQL